MDGHLLKTAAGIKEDLDRVEATMRQLVKEGYDAVDVSGVTFCGQTGSLVLTTQPNNLGDRFRAAAHQAVCDELVFEAQRLKIRLLRMGVEV